MKLIIASDIHGSAFWCGKLMELIETEQPDRILLLGDLLYHGPRNDLPRDYAPKQVIPMLSKYADKIIAVRGNCEAEVDQMVLPFPCMADFSQLYADGKLLYLTHGHHNNPDNLPPLPEGSLFLSGHTHKALIWQQDNCYYCNPGAVGQPRDGDPRASFAVLDDSGIISIHRVKYDIDVTARLSKEAGFFPAFYECLYEGAKIH